MAQKKFRKILGIQPSHGCMSIDVALLDKVSGPLIVMVRFQANLFALDQRTVSQIWVALKRADSRA